MNIYQEFLDLLPQTKRYYGQVISINGTTIDVQLIGGGIIKITSLDSNSYDNTHVWCELNPNGTWTISKAPNYTQYQIEI